MTNFNFNTSMTTDKDGSTNVVIDFKDSDGINVQINENGTDLFELYDRVIQKFEDTYVESIKSKEKEKAEKEKVVEDKTEKETDLLEKYKNAINKYQDALDKLNDNLYKINSENIQLKNKVQSLEKKLQTFNKIPTPVNESGSEIPVSFKKNSMNNPNSIFEFLDKYFG